MSEIQKADPPARRTAIAILACGTVLGVSVITLASRFRPDVARWLEEDPGARLPPIMMAMIVMTTGPAIGAAFYVWRLGRRVVRAERFPPPGLKVTRDTPVVTGPAAGRRGRLIQAFAVALGVLAVLVALTLWRLVNAVTLAAVPGA